MTNSLFEIFDAAAVAFNRRAQQNGALSSHVYADGPDRVVYSVEPYEDGVEHHISVTRNGQSVNNKVLTQYAERLIPEFDQYFMCDSRLINGLSHAWWKRKEVGR